MNRVPRGADAARPVCAAADVAATPHNEIATTNVVIARVRNELVEGRMTVKWVVDS
jgi:hypothetical protein